MSLDFIYAKGLFTANYANLEFSERRMKTIKKGFELSKNWTEFNDNVDKLILWKKVKESKKDENIKIKPNKKKKIPKINSLNRSIIFNENKVGPDISWIFP